MSAIYTQASQVVAYLGGSELGLSSSLEEVIDLLQEGNATPTLSYTIIRGLDELLSLRYFQRVWVLQEIGLAQLVTFVIGSQTVRWSASSIEKLLQLCFRSGRTVPATLRWTPARRPGEEDDLLQVVYKSRNCDATDPRDKIFALLGLVNPKYSVEFPVDYSLPVMSVFTKFAAYCMSMGRYDVLQHTSGNIRDTNESPTWVPQWDERLDYEPLPAQFSETDKEGFVHSWFVADSTWLQGVSWGEDGMAMVIRFASKAEEKVADGGFTASAMQLSMLTWRQYAEFAMKGLLAPADLNHLVQHLTHRQGQGFRYKICDYHIDRRRPGFPVKQPVPCLKIRAQRLDRIYRVLDTYVVGGIMILWEPLPALAGSDEVCAACAILDIDESILRLLPNEDIPMTDELNVFMAA